MKSNKQMRAKLKALKEARRKKTAYGEVVVNPANLALSNSYSSPACVLRGTYQPVLFACKSCGEEEAWTPHQQKWWYEVAKGDLFSRAIFCRPCRTKDRARKAEARRVHLEGLARKTAGKKS